MYSPDVEKMIQMLSRLPGLGPRSGRRAAIHLLKKKETHLFPLLESLKTAYERVETCKICFNIDTQNPCSFCTDAKRERQILCVVADVSDLWAIERSKVFKGHYHVLGGLLSATEGITPQQLTIDALLHRIHAQQVTDVVLALSATIDGQTTLHYIAERLSECAVKMTTLAHGVPIGGELDYLDDGTLTAAFLERRSL